MIKHRSAKQKKADQGLQVPENSSTTPSAMVRMKAFLVDMFMIGMPVAYLVIYVIMGGGTAFFEQKLLGWALIFAIHAPVYLLFLATKGQTPGMKAYELTLVGISSSGKPSAVALAMRYMLTPLSILSIVGIAVIFFRKDKLALHDLVSGTKNIFVNTNGA